jgi:multicomponent Na+:H+ antiporter subunit E
MRTLTRLALLVALWLLAWGDLSLANVLSGIAVASAVLVAFPPVRRAPAHVRVRPAGTARLLAYVTGQLVSSNILMTHQILRRHPDVRPGVIAHRLRHPSDEVVTVMTSIIALSPGTMTVDIDPTTIYVHFFRLRDIAAARVQLDRLEQLVTAAITTPAVPPSVDLTEEPA